MFTREQMENAWKADITDYLARYHAESVKREGQYLRMKSDHKVVFRRNSYFDNGTGEHGGPVDALVKYFGYMPAQAIEALAGVDCTVRERQKTEREVVSYAKIPVKTTGRYNRVFAYLNRTRGLPAETINDLMHRHILYQDDRGNVVFINPQGDTAEIRGTNSQRPYKSTRRTKPGGMWFYEPEEGRENRRVYICESAIDCISLYLLIQDREAVYVSMAGTGNTQIIDRILPHKPVCICTDNDEAGNKVRAKYSHLPNLAPYMGKDWNDEWLAWSKANSGGETIPA